MSNDYLTKIDFGCNSVFAAWPQEKYNTLPYTLNDLQSMKDFDERSPKAQVWQQCAPGTKDVIRARPKIPSHLSSLVELNSRPDSGFALLLLVSFGAVFLVGVLVGRVTKRESRDVYTAMP